MTTKTETFNFTENPLSTNWDTAQSPGMKSGASGADAVNGTAFGVSIWKSSNYDFDDDQSSTITVGSITAFYFIGVVVRYASTGGGVGYMAFYDTDNGRFTVVRYAAGAVAATLRITTSFSMVATDTLTLSITGTTLKGFKNGVQIGADIVVTGADIVTGGQPGISGFETGGSFISAWQGVDASGGASGNPWYYYAQQ